jgi:hypothetical protein
MDVINECAFNLRTCSVDGKVISNCQPGMKCILQYLPPGSTIEVPLGQLWAKAGSRNDLDIYYVSGSADFTTSTVMLDGLSVADAGSLCERKRAEVKCLGVRDAQTLRFSYNGSAVELFIDIRDFNCNAPPCQV